MDKLSMKKLEMVKEEARRNFLGSINEKINEALQVLLKLRISYGQDEIKKLFIFFHTLNGTASMLEYYGLSEIAKVYEKVLDEAKSSKELNHRVFSQILEGIAKSKLEADKICSKGYIPGAKKDEKATTSLDANPSSNYEYIYSLVISNILIFASQDDFSVKLDSELRNNAYFPSTADDPEKALDMIRRKNMDLLIIVEDDTSNSKTLTIAKLLKDNNLWLSIFVISRTKDPTEKMLFLKHGIEGYFPEPYDKNEFITSVHNLTDKMAKSKTEAYIDPAIGAFNKALFKKNYSIAQKRLQYREERFSIAFIDIDGFKKINDVYGHEQGNFLLNNFHLNIKKHLNSLVLIFHLENDKFALLFLNSTGEKAFKLVEFLRKEIQRETVTFNNGNTHIISFSAGIYEVTSEREESFDILDYIEKMVIKTKVNGGNKVILLKTLQREYVSDDAKEYDVSLGKILIIEDSAVIGNMIKQSLKVLGYDVEHAVDGDKGVLKARLSKPDIILLDINLPTSSGIEVAQIIKADKNISNTKIIIITSESKKETVKKCLEVGISGFLVKPIDLRELEVRIESLMQKNLLKNDS